MNRFLSLILAVSGAFALASCLPEEKDPQKVSDAGQVNGTFYASSLGNTALQIQEAVVSDSGWFNSTAGQALDLAAMGINASASGATVKSYICPQTGGKEALQLTWFDERDHSGNFSIRSVGDDVGSVGRELRQRVALDQLGTYQGGATLKLASGSNLVIPSSCLDLVKIPSNAPVLAFKITRPSSAVAATTRTEYRTVDCGQGMRGTVVQKRTVTYAADGSAKTGSWASESGGNNCVSVDMLTADVTSVGGGGSVSFGNVTGQQIEEELHDNLKMDCVTAGVTRRGGAGTVSSAGGRKISTCSTVALAKTSSFSAEVGDEVEELQTLPCTGVPDDGYASLGAFKAFVTHGQWSGGAQLKSKAKNVSVVETDGTRILTRLDAKWEPYALECSRSSKAVLRCGDITPNANSKLYNSDEAMYYSRKMSISGFKSLTDLIPNDTKITDWALTAGQCQWLEEEAIVPTCGKNEVAFNGWHKRIVRANPFVAGGYVNEPWDEVEKSECVYYAAACGGEKPLISFVIDKSGSIGTTNFEKVRSFFMKFMNQMDYVGTEPANIVEFTQYVKVLPFRSLDAAASMVLGADYAAEEKEMLAAKNDNEKTKIRYKHVKYRETLRQQTPSYNHPIVTDMKNQIYSGGGTAIGEGLIAAVDSLKVKAASMGKPDAPKLVILFTDGANTHGRAVPVATKYIADNNVKTFVIGVGNAKDKELLPVAKAGLQPGAVEGSNYQKLANFTGFSSGYFELTEGICKIVGAVAP